MCRVSSCRGSNIEEQTTHRLSERQSNLSAQSVEIVGRRAEVTDKPVDLVQLLHLKVFVFRLQEKEDGFLKTTAKCCKQWQC